MVHEEYPTDITKENLPALVERLHGTIRQRNKVMRGLDDEATAQTMMDGLRLYYNFIRPHSALDGKTPAQKAKIISNLESESWVSLIKKASNANPLHPHKP
jgi:hypothetical protein